VSEDLELRNEVSVRNLEALVCRGGGGLADKWTILLDFCLLVLQKEEFGNLWTIFDALLLLFGLILVL
jgi:hypothetical protein